MTSSIEDLFVMARAGQRFFTILKTTGTIEKQTHGANLTLSANFKKRKIFNIGGL